MIGLVWLVVGRHTVEECARRTDLRREVEKEEMAEWWTRHSRNRKKEKSTSYD